MPWSKLDDQFYDHPKTVQAGTLAAGLFAMALSYCSRHLTDGFVSAGMICKLASDIEEPLGLADKLFEAGYFERVDGGYMIHDYLEYNPSRADVLQQREIARRRSAMNANPDLVRLVRERDGNHCRYCGRWVDWRDRKGESGGTYDHVLPVAAGGDESPDNIVVCCRKCNLHKGARPLDEARMILLPPSSKPKRNRDQDGIKPESGRDSDNPSPDPGPAPDPVPSVVTGDITGADAPVAGKSPRKPKPPMAPSVAYLCGVANVRIKNLVKDQLAVAIPAMSGPDLEHWKAVVNTWIARGYNPRNVDGMLCWYRDGIPAQGPPRANGARASPPDSDGYEGIRDFLAEKGMKGDLDG